jgi:hypothetical protein
MKWTKICLVCGKEFETRCNTAKYCGQDCGRSVWERSRRAASPKAARVTDPLTLPLPGNGVDYRDINHAPLR